MVKLVIIIKTPVLINKGKTGSQENSFNAKVYTIKFSLLKLLDIHLTVKFISFHFTVFTKEHSNTVLISDRLLRDWQYSRYARTRTVLCGILCGRKEKSEIDPSRHAPRLCLFRSVS